MARGERKWPRRAKRPSVQLFAASASLTTRERRLRRGIFGAQAVARVARPVACQYAAPLVVCQCGEDLRLGGKQEKPGTTSRLEKGPGNPGGRRKPGKSLDLARKISVQRETESETRKTRQGKPARRTWKEVRRDVGDLDTSPEALRQRDRRASLVHAEDEAKEFAIGFATRLKPRLDQKPPRVGEAKARNEARVEKIRAHNRRKRRSKGRHQSQGRPVVR